MNNEYEYIDSIIAKLEVPYKDKSVLVKDSPELDLIEYYFQSITDNDKEVEELLWQCLGYSLCKTSELHKAFVFWGKGRNGKSGLARVLESILGEDQCSHESLENLFGSKAGSKSSAKFLEGCTVNISEDQRSVKFVDLAMLTRLISGEPITVGVIKEKDAEGHIIEKRNILKSYATMIFIVNDILDFKTTGKFLTDRLTVIKFNNTFCDDSNNRLVSIERDLCKKKSLQIIATKAIDSFKKVLDKGRFDIPPIVEQTTKRYFMDCNNVLEFCNLFPIDKFIKKESYHEEYCKWCESNNLEAYNNVKFGKEVLALGYRSERYKFWKKDYTCYVSPLFENADRHIVFEEYLEYCGLSEESIKVYKEEDLVRTIQKVIPFSEYMRNNVFKNEND